MSSFDQILASCRNPSDPRGFSAAGYRDAVTLACRAVSQGRLSAEDLSRVFTNEARAFRETWRGPSIANNLLGREEARTRYRSLSLEAYAVLSGTGLVLPDELYQGVTTIRLLLRDPFQIVRSAALLVYQEVVKNDGLSASDTPHAPGFWDREVVYLTENWDFPAMGGLEMVARIIDPVRSETIHAFHAVAETHSLSGETMSAAAAKMRKMVVSGQIESSDYGEVVKRISDQVVFVREAGALRDALFSARRNRRPILEAYECLIRSGQMSEESRRSEAAKLQLLKKSFRALRRYDRAKEVDRLLKSTQSLNESGRSG